MKICRSDRPTWATHAYYRTAIVPAIREECGYITDAEAHRAIKGGFYEMHPDDPRLPSMAKMSQEEAGRLIEYAIVQAAEMHIVLKDPRRAGS